MRFDLYPPILIVSFKYIKESSLTMFRQSLLILGIIFVILGVLLPLIPYFPDVIGTVLWVLGVIAIVIWIVLYFVTVVSKSGA